MNIVKDFWFCLFYEFFVYLNLYGGKKKWSGSDLSNGIVLFGFFIIFFVVKLMKL